MKTNASSGHFVLAISFGLIASLPLSSFAEDEKKLSLKVTTTTAVHGMENADFREIDESSDRAVIDSDDRRLFAYTDLWSTLGYQAHKEVKFNLKAQYGVKWKDDQMGRSSGHSGNVNIYGLNIDYVPISTRKLKLSFTAGRQRFRIGGVPRDYMLDGTLDALTASIDFKKFGRLRVLGIDFFGGNGLPQTGYFYYRDGRTTTYNLRGETNTLRTGVIYEFDKKAHRNKGFFKDVPLEARAYYFYATIGGGPIEESGADITYGGALGNYRDRDYQHLMGARLAFENKLSDEVQLRVYGEFAHSMGIDRKAVTDRDVDTSGSAYGGGLEAKFKVERKMSIGVNVEWYHFDGAEYASDGLEFKRGFVGFKGDRIGGSSVGRYSAWRPSSHVDASGVINGPHDRSRVSGTQFLHGELSFAIADFTLRGGYWMFKDTSSTFLKMSQLNDPGFTYPFGHTEAEYRAQERLGLELGQAIDAQLSYQLNEVLQFFTEFGAFLPGEYYAIEVDRVAGDRRTSLGGDAKFFVGSIGLGASF